MKTSSAKTAGATDGGNRKPAADQPGHRATARHARAGIGDGGRAFKARLQEGDTPPGVCECAWHGDTFPRSSFCYSHHHVVAKARSGAPTPSRPQRPQQAAFVADGGESVGRLGRFTPSIRYNRTNASGSGGGPLPGPDTSRGNGGNTK